MTGEHMKNFLKIIFALIILTVGVLWGKYLSEQRQKRIADDKSDQV